MRQPYGCSNRHNGLSSGFTKLLLVLLTSPQQSEASFFAPETRSARPTSTSALLPLLNHDNITDLITPYNTTSPFDFLLPRGGTDCIGTPCGYYNQVCCGLGLVCYTNILTQAACSSTAGASAAASGYWSYFTSTNTQTITQVYSTWIPLNPAQTTTLYVPLVAQTTTTQVAVNCRTSQGETACGGICCGAGEYCVVAGQCGVSGHISTTTTTTLSGGTASPPLRVTSSTLKTVTTSINPTTTEGFLPAIATGNVTLTSMSSSGELSGGAIAGIVVGVVAAVILLLLLCLFLCFRAVWDGIFGGGGRRRGERVRRRVVTEEGWYRGHDSRADGRSGYSGGYYGGGGSGGGRPSRPQRPRRDDDDGGGGLGWKGVLAGLGGLGLALGLDRRNREKERRAQMERQRRRRHEKSESSGYTDDTSYLTRSDEQEERVWRNGREVTREEFIRESRRTRR